MGREVELVRARAAPCRPRSAGGPTTSTVSSHGRSCSHLILVRLGYPPAIVYKRQRADYLRSLRRADQGDAGQLGELLARAVLDNLYRFVVPAIASPARLVPLAALADGRINADALRTAAVRGRLQATRGADGQWRSTRNWVDDYLQARYRRTVSPDGVS